METREGNQIFPADAPIRKAMGKTLCAKCLHAADQCYGVAKRTARIYGYVLVEQCTGFEVVSEGNG